MNKDRLYKRSVPLPLDQSGNDPHKISGPIGCDTTAILKELGYSDEKIRSMYDAGDIR